MPVAGIMPYKLLMDTHLKSGEKRLLNLKLPMKLSKEKIARVELSIRFYDVSDEYQGDITKAHWISNPILIKRQNFVNQ